MEIRIRENGQVMYEGELRAYLAANNGPSYDQLTPEVMEALEVDPVLEGPAAECLFWQFSQRDGVEQIDGKWHTKYIAGPVFATPEEKDAYIATKTAEQAKATREAAKAKRAADVEAIIVTTSTGRSFNGDETSQGRMARAVLVLQAVSAKSTTWVLADNTPVTVTVPELVEALALAGAAQSALWVIK